MPKQTMPRAANHIRGARLRMALFATALGAGAAVFGLATGPILWSATSVDGRPKPETNVHRAIAGKGTNVHRAIAGKGANEDQ